MVGPRLCLGPRRMIIPEVGDDENLFDADAHLLSRRDGPFEVLWSAEQVVVPD